MPRAPFHLDSLKSILSANGEMRAADLARAADLRDSTLIAAVAPGLASGVLVKRTGDRREVFYALADGVEVEAADDFNAALWADGDLVLVGVELNADGKSVTLAPERVDMLRQLLRGQPA